MKAFLLLLLGMLRDFVTSKKVLTAVLTAVAGALIKDPTTRDRIVAIGLMLLGGQALTDHGKAAEEVKAAVAAKAPLSGSISAAPFVSGFTVGPAVPVGGSTGTVPGLRPSGITTAVSITSTPAGPTP